MKTKNLLLALLSASLLYACTNDDTHIPVANDQETEATNEVSLNAAKNMLEDFVGDRRFELVFKISSLFLF